MRFLCFPFLSFALLLIFSVSALAYPPDSEEVQEKRAQAVAWCEVTQIELLEKPRIELGLSSQLRNYTLRVTEVVRGDIKVGTTFSLRFAHYEVLSAAEMKYIVQPEILVWEIHRRPELKVGREYKVYFGKQGEEFLPLNGR